MAGNRPGYRDKDMDVSDVTPMALLSALAPLGENNDTSDLNETGRSYGDGIALSLISPTNKESLPVL